MKYMILAVIVLGTNAFSSYAQSPTYNNNQTINITGCCLQKCKPKIIVKKVIVEKPVEKIVEKVVEKKVYVEHEVIVKRIIRKVEHKRNRISMLAGVGPTHLNQSSSNEVDLDKGLVGGVQFQRTFSETSSWSWGAQSQTGLDGKNSGSLLGIVGYDF